METKFLSELPKVHFGNLSLNVKDPSTYAYVLHDQVMLECLPNYMPFRDPNSGQLIQSSSVIENSLGELVWSPAELECGLGTLPDIENGECFSNQSPPFREGDSATVTCLRGYETQLPEIKVIAHEESLIWNETDPCKPRTLGELPQAIHGTFVLPPGPYPLGTQATLQCDEDYEASYPISEVVWDDSTQTLAWWPNPSECFRSRCPPPPRGALQLGGGREFWSRIAYFCPPGFELIGIRKDGAYPLMSPYESKCSVLGTWDPDLPAKFECKRAHCPEPEKILYGTLQYSRIEGGSAIYKCFDKSIPTVTRICQSNGKWSGSAPICPNYINSSSQSTLQTSCPLTSKLWMSIIFLTTVCLFYMTIQKVRRKIKRNEV